MACRHVVSPVASVTPRNPANAVRRGGDGLVPHMQRMLLTISNAAIRIIGSSRRESRMAPRHHLPSRPAEFATAMFAPSRAVGTN